MPIPGAIGRHGRSVGVRAPHWHGSRSSGSRLLGQPSENGGSSALTDLSQTIVFFEAPHRVRASLEAVGRVLGDRYVVVARELTKVHETVARGWLSVVLAKGIEERGEFTILVSDQTRLASEEAVAPNSSSVRAEFGVLTKNVGLSRKDAVQQLAAKYGVSRQSLYKMLNSAPSLCRLP